MSDVPTPLPVHSHWRSVAADFTASYISFNVALLFAHPWETLRVRLHTRGQLPMDTLRRDGFRSLFAGVFAPMVVMSPLSAATWGFMEDVKDRAADAGVLRRAHVENSTIPHALDVLPCTGHTLAETFAGGTASGLLMGLPMCPMGVVRTQQQNQSVGGARPPSALGVAKKLMRVEGLAGFCRGNSIVTFAGSFGRGVYFTSYDASKHVFGVQPGANTSRNFMANMGATGVTTVLFLAYSFPLSFISTKLQGEPIAPRAERHYKGRVRNVVLETWKEAGVRGFYRGLHLAFVRSALWSAVQLPLYDRLRPSLRHAAGVPDAIDVAPAAVVHAGAVAPHGEADATLTSSA